MNQLTFFAEEPHANPSRLRDCEKDWMTREGTSCSPMGPLQQGIGPAGYYGRTCPESFQAPMDETLAAFWASSRAARSSHPKMDWATVASSPALPTPTESLGECLTLNTSEHAASAALSPRDDAVCGLSDILETGDVPLRYFLTAKACQGILRRAEKRGKSLPPLLQQALGEVARSSDAEGPPTSADGVARTIKDGDHLET